MHVGTDQSRSPQRISPAEQNAFGITNNSDIKPVFGETRITDQNRTQFDESSKGKKIYKCHECDKTFTRSYNFRIHQRTHTG